MKSILIKKRMISYSWFMSILSMYVSYLFLTNSYEIFIQLFSTHILYFLGFPFDQIELKKVIDDFPTRIMIVTSHTSVYDFIIGFCVYQIYFRKRYHVQILMKQSFENYVSPFLKYIDSRFRIIKVEDNKQGLTTKIVEQLKYQDHYLIGLSPEGTRRCNPILRKGFHYIAKELKIPILYMGIDYDQKKIIFEPLLETTTWEEDEIWFQQTCIKYPPLFPDQCYWTRNEYLEETTTQERSIQSSSDSASELGSSLSKSDD